MTFAQTLRRLRREQRGIALVEFALTAPFLILLYLGTYQVSDAVGCNRKVTITARSVADLTSQYATVTSASEATILNASAQIMAPYDTSKATIIVSELYTDNNNVTKIVWSQATGTVTPHTAGATFTANPNLVTSGTYSIVAEVTYAYVPAMSFGVVGPLSLGDTIYMRPRISSAVTMS
ncbi:TadE/TadG family type IV pilus assembly protein [Sphingomonas sp. RT2P30]|uniref:TadE/TadG family type IV pilus assembly protein n=1 Tax=Parasphingomonas halimpatiens TaxID=3096162 RepID=UPI002FC68AB3